MQRSLREDILDAGLKVMFHAGYVGATVRDICETANAPHGSFTNHFGSKEQFAKEVLDRYFANLKMRVDKVLSNGKMAPRRRLERYFQLTSDILKADDWQRGCLIGDLSIEASFLSEIIRDRLVAIFEEWRTPFAACLREAQKTGDLDSRIAPDDLADFLLASWEGAILRMKVERGPAPLERFQKIIFDTVLKKKTR
jgi:TetR/AcrR family transcriptional regulator, transcriptional repressor for nem operon